MDCKKLAFMFFVPRDLNNGVRESHNRKVNLG